MGEVINPEVHLVGRSWYQLVLGQIRHLLGGWQQERHYESYLIEIKDFSVADYPISRK